MPLKFLRMGIIYVYLQPVLRGTSLDNIHLKKHEGTVEKKSSSEGQNNNKKQF